ncbi:MAG TPA: hypothetical protein VFW07_03145 [Parafilimonas sp.]|nr:hypothetical protein [Parafilimonas sp.]
MKFRLFNLKKIKEVYLEQLEEFAEEYPFLLRFSFKNTETDFVIKQNEHIVSINRSGIYTEHNAYTWNDLSLEDLDCIIENILEPALLSFEIREKGTLN